MSEHAGNTPLFAVFVLAIMALVMTMLTLWKMCSGGSEEEEEVVQPWLTADKRKKSIVEKLRGKITFTNILLLLGWVATVLLFTYVSEASREMKPFDPFEILQLSSGATEREVKKAYRKMSLIYHPDKNPDPAAHTYFAEHITKAYQALTDETARKNYEKYGHPDGPQSMNLGVALPEWVFSKDSTTAPWLLAALVGGGILAPLAIAACFLLRESSNGSAGQTHQLTLGMFLHSKYNIKESQGLPRIPETLVIAMDFINLPTPPDQQQALLELRNTVLRLHPDLREKSQFWKRKPSVVKVHLLLLAYLSRENVPAPLEKDLHFLLKRAPELVEDMVKVAQIPRPPLGCGWLTPALACVEFVQCMVQAVPLSSRKPIITTSGRAMDSSAPLLQLPHFGPDLLRKLSRKKVKGLQDLQDMQPEERRSVLAGVGMKTYEIEQVECAMSALPSLTVGSVTFTVDDVEEDEDQDLMEGDVITCSVRVELHRASHKKLAIGKEGIRGKATQAFAPLYPHPKPEQWWFVLGEPSSNALLSITPGPVKLLEAEKQGARRTMEQMEGIKPALQGPGAANGNGSAASSSSGSDNEEDGGDKDGDKDGQQQQRRGPEPTHQEGGLSADDGQLLELKFRAPKAGKKELVLYAMCDSWIGADRAIPLRIRVTEQTRAEQEGRTHRGKSTPLDGDASGSEGEEGEDNDEEDEEEDEDYDSEEGSTEESGEDDDEDSSDEDDDN